MAFVRLQVLGTRRVVMKSGEEAAKYGTRYATLGRGTEGSEGREGLKGEPEQRKEGGETFLSQIWLSESRSVIQGRSRWGSVIASVARITEQCSRMQETYRIDERTDGAQRRQLIIPRQLLGGMHSIGFELAGRWDGHRFSVLCELLDWEMLSQIWRARLLKLRTQCLKPQGSSVHELLR